MRFLRANDPDISVHLILLSSPLPESDEDSSSSSEVTSPINEEEARFAALQKFNADRLICGRNAFSFGSMCTFLSMLNVTSCAPPFSKLA